MQAAPTQSQVPSSLAENPLTNKVEKLGAIFDAKKVTVNSPRLPRIPPQLHHDLPPRCTTKSAKTPQNRHSTTPI
jgi:hypothetical protein